MRNIIKKLLILSLINLLIPITSLSQVTFDSIEVKEIALICNEHHKLSVENPLLKQQIQSLEELNSLYIKSDSILKLEIDLYKDEIISNNEEIKKLKSSNKRTIIGSSIGGIVLFIIGLLL